jgi:hypothetical protein
MTGTAGSLIAVLDFCLVTTLGWTKPYSGTNTAVYKQAGGSGAYLWVDDTNAQNSRYRGWEVASGVGVGLNPFPNDSQQSGGDYFYKSSTADATNRGWFFVGNSKSFWLICGSTVAASAIVYASTQAITGGMGFGEYVPFTFATGLNHPFPVFVAGSSSASATAANSFWSTTSTATWGTLGGHYIARPQSGWGGSTQVGALGDMNRIWQGGQYAGSNGSPYPNTFDGGLVMSRRFLIDINYGPWATYPGYWMPCHSQPLPHGEVFVGTAGSIADGRTFEVVGVGGAAGGQVFFEISDTWD